MIKVLLFDFARVLLFATHETTSTLSQLYLEQSGEDQFVLNYELLSFIHEQRVKCTTAILTNSASILSPGTHYRQEMEKYFDHIFISKELGLSKDQPACYLKTASLLNVEPTAILFTDDKLSNCEAAQQAGLQVVHFHTTEQYVRDSKKFLV